MLSFGPRHGTVNSAIEPVPTTTTRNANPASCSSCNSWYTVASGGVSSPIRGWYSTIGCCFEGGASCSRLNVARCQPRGFLLLPAFTRWQELFGCGQPLLDPTVPSEGGFGFRMRHCHGWMADGTSDHCREIHTHLLDY
jgi:hypothetical protein